MLHGLSDRFLFGAIALGIGRFARSGFIAMGDGWAGDIDERQGRYRKEGKRGGNSHLTVLLSGDVPSYDVLADAKLTVAAGFRA